MSADWRDGYPADFGYIYEYQAELNPSHLRFALVDAGFAPPPIDAPFNYCELGFGQGVTLNVLASTHPGGSFVGNDISPEHVRFARRMQEVSGSRLSTFEDGFESFCDRPLPPMDFIVAHGVWSWVNPRQWKHVVEFVRRHLRPGGVFYLSYNALPGWARYTPLHEIIRSTARMSCPKGLSPGQTIERTLAQVAELRAVDAGYFSLHPQAAARFDRLGANSAHYLAHEYLNEHWTPCYFHDVNELMSEAKLSYACSADLVTHLDFLELGAESCALLGRMESSVLRETYRDFLCNRQFRRDLYVKGAQRLSQLERRELLLEFRFALNVPRAQISWAIEAPAGRATLDESIYRPLVDVLDESLERCVGLDELLADPRVEHIGFDKVYQALLILVIKGDVSVVSPTLWQNQRVHVDRLNAWILEQATRNRGLPLLACPVTRGARPVLHVDQIFLDGIVQGIEAERELVDYAEFHVRQTGRQLTDAQGEELRDASARRSYLAQRLAELRAGPLKILQSRGMIRTIGHMNESAAAPHPIPLRRA